MAELEHARGWLKALGRITQARMSHSEAAEWLDEIGPMLASRFDDEALCRGSLETVAAECKYLPTYGEIVEHLRGWRGSQLRIAGPTPPPKLDYPGPRSELERNHATAIVREAVAELRMRGVEKQARTDSAQPVWQRPPTQMTRAQLDQAYRRAGVKGPVVTAKPEPLRAAAAEIRPETRKGQVVP